MNQRECKRDRRINHEGGLPKSIRQIKRVVYIHTFVNFTIYYLRKIHLEPLFLQKNLQFLYPQILKNLLFLF